ncbi:MAG: hypothetical protein WCS35_10765, partial [Sphaerochaeta sp.]
KLTGPSFSASIQQADLSISLSPKLELSSLKGSIERVEAQSGQAEVQLDTILLDMDSSLAVNAETGIGKLIFADTEAQYEQLALASQLSSLDISKGVLDIDFSVSNLTVANPVLQASLPKLSSRLSLVDLAFSSLEASYDKLDLKAAGFVLQTPTSTINLKQGESSLLLGFATKTGVPITLLKEGFSSLKTDSLLGSAQMEKSGKIYARLSLQDIETQMKGISFELNQVQLTSDAFLGPEGIDNISISLESEGTVNFNDADITLSSPLSAYVNLSDKLSTLSSSLSLSELTSDLIDEPFSAELAYQKNPLGGQAQASISLTNQLLLNALYDLPEYEKGTFSIQGRMQDFPIALVRPTLERYAPFLKPYYSDLTSMTGNLSFKSTQGTGTILGFDGTFSSDLVLLDASLGNRNLNAGFTVLAGIKGDSVVVESLNLSTSEFRLAYSGSTELNNWLPSGDLQFYDTEKGTLLISANFSPLPPNKYRYGITTPLVPSLLFDGVIAKEGLENLIGKADLSVYGQAYPLDFTFRLPTLQLELDSGENLALEAYLAPPYRANLVAKNLAMPTAGLFTRSSLDGHFILQFNTLDDWRLEANDFSLAPIVFNKAEYALEGSLFVFPSSLKSSNLTLSQGSSQFDLSFEYQGSELINTYQAEGLLPFTFTFVVSEENIPKISLALRGDSKRIETLIEINQVGLQRFYSPLSDVSLNFTAYGFTDFKKKVSMDGKLGLESPQFSFSSDLSATDTQLKIEHALIKQGSLVFKDMQLSVDALEGLILAQGKFNHIRTIPYTEQTSHFNLSLSIPFKAPGSLFTMGRVIRSLPSDGLSGNLAIDDLLLLGEKGIADGNYSFYYKNNVVGISSSLLSGSYD